MKAVVAGAQAGRGLDLQRRVGGQTAGLGVEPQLPNRIGARALPQGFQDIIVEAGDVGHKGKLVGGVGLDGVGAHGRGQRVAGWGAYRAVRTEGMDRRIPALIIRREQKPARAVGGQKRGRVGRRDRPLGREPAGGGVDPEARNCGLSALPDIQRLPVRLSASTDGPPRPAPRPGRELAGGASMVKVTILSSSCRPT